LGCLTAPEINAAEKTVIADVVKREVSVAILFDVIRPTFVEAIPLAMDAPAGDACAAQLMVVDCLLCKLTTPGEVLLLVYSDLRTLASLPAAAFVGAQLSNFELDTLMRAGGGGGGGGGSNGGEVTTLAAFITHQVKSDEPGCRGLAYRLLGLLANRVFDRLGDKIVQLLIKKRANETPDNQLVIACVLWNVLFVWTERVGPVLLQPTHVREAHGVPEHWWDLTQDLWRDDVPALQAVALLSACRYVAARRGPPATNDHVARDILLSLLARRGVARAVKNQIGVEHYNHRTAAAGAAAGPRKKSTQSVPTAAGGGVFALPLDALEDHDRHDALLVQRLLAPATGLHAVSPAALRYIEADALAHGLRQAVAAPAAAAAAGSGALNLTYVQRAVEIWVSLVRQLCGSDGRARGRRHGHGHGHATGHATGAAAVATEAFELFTEHGAAVPDAARAVGDDLHALLAAAYAAHAVADDSDNEAAKAQR
jgi:hypothetical protein